jgi:hypothetical protein
MAHGIGLHPGRVAVRNWRAPWLIAGLLSATAMAGCYPNPDDLRPREGSGGHAGGGGATGNGNGGAPGGTGGAGTGTGAGGAAAGSGGTAAGGAGGRNGSGGFTGGAGGAGGMRVGTGGATGVGGAATGVGGATPGTGGSGTGGAGAPHCGGQPCGGDVVGTWDAVLNCAAPKPDSTSCPGETVTYGGIQRTGFITFSTGLTYVSQETQSGTFQIDTPMSCLVDADVTCAAFDAGYKAQAQPMGGSTYSSASCITTAFGCRCVLGVIPQIRTEAGLFGVNGTKLMLTPTSPAGATNTDDFCVEGTSLRIIYPDSTAASPQELLLQKR